MLIKSADQAGSVATLYIGGDGVNQTDGYPLSEGQSIGLPLSAGVRVFAVEQGGVLVDPDARTLELG